jgi:molybdopterin-containing oxidoreductase family iron-sulfur binding subunit
MLHREFPQGASEWAGDDVSRRNFLKLMGASLALAGVYGCTRQPDEKIVPYVAAPEQVVPGKPLFFATAMPMAGGFGLGLLAESHTGRPTKLEGNPDHPASLGATDHIAQASVLTLYDPDRAKVVQEEAQPRTWGAFLEAIRGPLAAERVTGGAGLRILTETITSPTLIAQMQELLKQFPQAQWHHYDPCGRDNVNAGAVAAFGKPVNTIYDLSKARRILALDADSLHEGPAAVRYSRQWAQWRKVRIEEGGTASPSMNRLYVIESTPTATGAAADHCKRVRASEIESQAREIFHELRSPSAARHPWIRALAGDLKSHRGESVVIAGDVQPASVHALAHAMNVLLGAVGETVQFTDPIEALPTDGVQSLRHLVDDMAAGRVNLLIILGANPVYTAPVDFNIIPAMQKVPLRVHHSLYYDETSYYSHWHIPETHYLEQWGDVRAFDGTASIIQPLIAPLYQGKSAHELMEAVLGRDVPSGLEILQRYWRGQIPGGANFEQAWHEALRKGVIDGTQARTLQGLRLAEGGSPRA